MRRATPMQSLTTWKHAAKGSLYLCKRSTRGTWSKHTYVRAARPLPIISGARGHGATPRRTSVATFSDGLPPRSCQADYRLQGSLPVTTCARGGNGSPPLQPSPAQPSPVQGAQPSVQSACLPVDGPPRVQLASYWCRRPSSQRQCVRSLCALRLYSGGRWRWH